MSRLFLRLGSRGSALKQLSASLSSFKFEKLEWYEPVKPEPKIERDNLYSGLTYDEQLKFKRNEFIQGFENVLITLAYDEKMDIDFKLKQQDLGEKLLNTVPDVIPLSNVDYSHQLSREIMEMGCNNNEDRIVIGRFAFNKIDISERDEEIETGIDQPRQNNYNFSKDYPEYFPEQFKLIASHVEEYINQHKLPCKERQSFYTKNWNWNEIVIRKSSNNECMLVVPINPSNLSKVKIDEIKDGLRDYFQTGPGKDMNLHSLYMHILNPDSDYKFKEDSFIHLLGEADLKNESAGKVFSYSPYNFYPTCLEAYSNLNVALADMIIRKAQHTSTELLIEFDCQHAILGVLVKDHCKRYYPMIAFSHLKSNVESNLYNHDLTKDYYQIRMKFSNFHYHIRNIVEENGPDCKITVVYTSNETVMPKVIRDLKKKFLISLRKYAQVKTILFVSNLHFKREHYCYELMSEERLKLNIHGRPFTAVEASLIDHKAGFSGYNAIIRLERD